jgi:hypothetical protein
VSQIRVKVEKRGENMNSPYPSRRYLYLSITPDDLLNVIGDLKNLSKAWETYFSLCGLWTNARTCNYCRKRVEYEIESYKLKKYVWQRQYCMRHYLVKHLDNLLGNTVGTLMSNRPFRLEADEDNIKFTTATTNYNYDILIDREKAVLTCIYKQNKKYVFTYKNHLNAYPYMSTYQYIIATFTSFFDDLAKFLDSLHDKITNNEKDIFNVLINNELVIEAQE